MKSTNPTNGVSAATNLLPSDRDEVCRVANAAERAGWELRRAGRDLWARLLDQLASATEQSREELVSTAAVETGLSLARLNGEVTRSAAQFALFAAAVREGTIYEAIIDHGVDTAALPAPDVRRMLMPIGPVAVFGASNFPFAFSVLGGDTASAVAAGCPVVVKAHGSHLLTSALSFAVLKRAETAAGAAEGTFGIVYGQPAGTELVKHPAIKAASFTGSLGAANALRAAIDTRPDPIPFFGELSSVNPLIITARAAQARGATIAEGLFASVTGSAGQLCTKPGISFVPSTDAGDDLVNTLAELVNASAPQVLLNDRIAASYREINARMLVEGGHMAAVATGENPHRDGFTVAPMVVTTDAARLDSALVEECFGPLAVIARYSSLDEVALAIQRVPRSLTTTLHAEPEDEREVAGLLPMLESVSGRIIFNGFPTGVRVCWAMNHGGPWPATNTQYTSVGVTAVRRFQRPVAWQSAPEYALPAELRDGEQGLPRRVNGTFVLAPRTAS